MDVEIGRDAYLTISVADPGSGRPLTDVVADAQRDTYGPGSDTVAIDSALGALTRIGPGVYAFSLSQGVLATPGLYRTEVTSPTLGLVAARFPFRVGTIPPGAVRLRDLLVSLIRGTGGSVRPSASINGTALVDPYWISAGSGVDLRGSEVVLIDPASQANYADWLRSRVQSFTPGSGTLTVGAALNGGADTSGRHYALCNIQGQGWAWERILDELRVAWDEARPTVVASTSVALATADDRSEYAIPPEFVSVARVYVRARGDRPPDLWDDLGGQWGVQRDRRLLRLNPDIGLDSPGYDLRVEGAIRADLPPNGGAWTVVRGAWLRERVRFGLLVTSPLAAHQRAANAIYANLSRQPSPHRRALPGEVWLR